MLQVRILAWFFLVWAWNCTALKKNDVILLQIPVAIDNRVENTTKVHQFSLRYSQVDSWNTAVEDFCSSINILPHRDIIVKEVVRQLGELGFPDQVVEASASTSLRNRSESVASAVQELLLGSINAYSSHHTPLNWRHPYFFSSRRLTALQRPAAFQALLQDLLAASDMDALKKAVHPVRRSMLPNWLLQQSAPITVFQTQDVFTGGTTAMRVLANTLTGLGYNILLCNATNADSIGCRHPSGDGLAMTGEWCDAVISSYTHTIHGNYTYKGRGMQYFLGFHHGRHSCRGWIAMTDSHYLHHLLGSKGMHAYYLGCPMSESMESAFMEVLAHVRGLIEQGGFVDVLKEDLIVVDRDFFTDYAPHDVVDILIPRSFKTVFAEGLSPELMVNLLQRAKVTADLGMPGPERLSSEATLFGALPIISHRWNGASAVDFPELRRVDALNASAVTNAISETFATNKLHPQQIEHFMSVLSMWKQLSYTADVVFGSASVHFIVIAGNLQEEYLAAFQLLGLLYLLPLCSVDLYVKDVSWFKRHHYLLWDHLRQAGYARYDPFDPQEYEAFVRADSGPSFVNIKRLADLNKTKDKLNSKGSCLSDEEQTCFAHNQTMGSSALTPAWPVLTAHVPAGWMFKNPQDLFEMANDTQDSSLIVNPSGVIMAGSGSTVGLFISQLHLALSTRSSSGESRVHVCDVLGESGLDEQVISGLRTVPVWMMMKTFAEEMEFQCQR